MAVRRTIVDVQTVDPARLHSSGHCFAPTDTPLQRHGSRGAATRTLFAGSLGEVFDDPLVARGSGPRADWARPYCGGYASNTGNPSPPQDQFAREP